MTISKLFRSALAISALCIGFAQSATAAIKTWTGDTTGAPTVDLTGFDPEFGAANPYHLIGFTVDTEDVYTFSLQASAHDTVIVLYENSFNVADPTTNALDGNDDDVYWSISTIAAPLSVGTTYYVLVTGYDEAAYGDYSLTIAGPGVITAVPEPSAWLMLALGLATVTYAQRRKSKR